MKVETNLCHEPTCGAKTRPDDWYCGLPAAYRRGFMWRCAKHRHQGDRPATPQEFAIYDAGQHAREARANLQTINDQLKRNQWTLSADRAALADVWLDETVGARPTTLTATVHYLDDDWNDATVTATVEMYGRPRLTFISPSDRARGGAWAKAMSALWAWVAEKIAKGMREHYAELLPKTDALVDVDLGEAEAKVRETEATLASLKESAS